VALAIEGVATNGERMDWLTFISMNIKSLAWPAVAVTILFVLKDQGGVSVEVGT
jgi:hypothetical protein